MIKGLVLGMVGGLLAVAGVHAETQETRYVETAAATTTTTGMAHDMDHMAMKPAIVTSGTAETESTKAFKAADAKMHKAMSMSNGGTYTGDADVDFLRGMIPHHQGAVDMANIVLKYGTDAEVKMLAGDIVKAQEKEIRLMQDWLAKHGPKDASASDARVELPVTVPVAKVTTVSVVATVSETGVISGTMPATPSVSGTTAMEDMPDMAMPAPDEAITNAAPQMELLDQPLAMTIGEPTGTGNAAK